MLQQLITSLLEGNRKTLARCISIIENEVPGYEQLLQLIPENRTPVIGLTGPPGAGKSSLTDALIGRIVQEDKSAAILCVDPSSPFNLGSLLGDRIRMNSWYNNPKVFIRSLATRGSLGGLHPKIIEICDLMKVAGFDYIIVETVGVGQSEIEIAGLADITAVVLVPEAGDEVQTMKAGLMEIADVFVVNKSDRPGADLFVKNLRAMLPANLQSGNKEIPVIKTIATNKEGVEEFFLYIKKACLENRVNSRRYWLLAEKAYQLICRKRMNDIDKAKLKAEIESIGEEFNLYRYISRYG